ncbi:hypothetical protein ACWXWI_22165 [Pantoea ananatis]
MKTSIINGSEVSRLSVAIHAFISTEYYQASPAVPTWNYDLTRVMWTQHSGGGN